jgi:alpha-tubulin suppressor-like RCC1 family protein
MRTLLTRGATLVAALTLFVASAGPATADSQRFVQISTGDFHTCGLTSSGAAYCWGANFEGQLGDGTTTISGVNGPQAVIGGLKFASISVGYISTCGLTSSGAAYCWGSNGNGQLGDGTTTSSGVNGPQRVIGGLKFASIQPGAFHTCGLTSRGAAYCWGENNYGQLGDGTTTDSNANGPQRVLGGLKFASNQPGAFHTCGLTTRGATYCWGRNVEGQLGDGTTTSSGVNGPQAVQ